MKSFRKFLAEDEVEKLNIQHDHGFKVMQSDKWKAKVKQQLKHVPILIESFRIEKHDSVKDTRGNMVFSDYAYENEFGQINPAFSGSNGLNGIEAESGKIVFLILGNSSRATIEGDIPLTPWMVAHRLSHAIAEADINNELNFRRRSEIAFNKFVDENKDIIKDNGRLVSFSAGSRAEWLSAILYETVTMNSARTGQLTIGDEYNEIFAEISGSGKVRLSPDRYKQSSVEEGIGSYANDPEFLRGLEPMLVQAFKECIELAKGKIFFTA